MATQKSRSSRQPSRKASPKKRAASKGGAPRRRVRAEKWQVVENVVAALERVKMSVPGTTVEQKALLPCLADPKDTREIDVLVSIPASGRVLQVGIDVKNEARALSTESLGTLIEKRDEVGLGSYCVVSTAGFSAPARRKAHRKGVHLVKLEEFTVSDFWQGPPGQRLIRSSIKDLRTTFVFSEQVLKTDAASIQATLAMATYDNTVLHAVGGSLTLRQVASGQLTKEAQQQLTDAEDGEHAFTLSMLMDTCTGLTVNGADLPVPERAEFIINAVRSTETLPEVRFRIGPIEISTVQMDVLGERKQISIVAVPQPTGKRQLVFTHGPAKPKAKPSR